MFVIHFGSVCFSVSLFRRVSFRISFSLLSFLLEEPSVFVLHFLGWFQYLTALLPVFVPFRFVPLFTTLRSFLVSRLGHHSLFLSLFRDVPSRFHLLFF